VPEQLPNAPSIGLEEAAWDNSLMTDGEFFVLRPEEVDDALIEDGPFGRYPVVAQHTAPRPNRAFEHVARPTIMRVFGG
jgi:hypothetical protein